MQSDEGSVGRAHFVLFASVALAACVSGVDPEPFNSTAGTGGGSSASSGSGFVGSGSVTSNSSSAVTAASSSSSAASSSSSSSAASSSSSSAVSSSSSSAASSSSSSGAGGAASSSSVAAGGAGTGGSGTGGAPPSGLRLQYKANDTNPTDNQMKPVYRIMNDSLSSVPLSELTIRYWYTLDGGAQSVFYCDYATVGCGNITGSFVTAMGTNADQYILVGFSAAAGSVSPGGNSGEIQTRIQRSDFTSYNESNDYSFDPTKTSFTDWTRVTLYRNGTLVWGTEP